MSEQDNRDTLERYRQEFFERQDLDAIADLMHARVADHYPRTTFHTVSLGTSVNKLENGTLLRMCPTTLACSLPDIASQL